MEEEDEGKMEKEEDEGKMEKEEDGGGREGEGCERRYGEERRE